MIYSRDAEVFQHLQINQCDTPHNKMDKPYVIISIDAEKDSDKIKHLALIKKKKKLVTN